jgi:hypothetical protein
MPASQEGRSRRPRRESALVPPSHGSSGPQARSFDFNKMEMMIDGQPARVECLAKEPSRSCSASLLRLPLAPLMYFVVHERALRATCRRVREAMPWSPKEGPSRELRQAWEGLRPGEADPLDVAASARSRLNEILFRQLRIRKILDKRMLARAAKYLVMCLDLCVSRGESAAVTSLTGFLECV